MNSLFVFFIVMLGFGLLARAEPLPVHKADEKVRVRLATGQTSLHLQGWSLAYQESEYLPVAIPRSSQSLSIERASIERDGEKHWMWKIIQEGRTALSASPYLQISAQSLQAQNRLLLPPQVLLTAGKGAQSGHFDIVGLLPLEDYLVGVLAGEVPANWPMEALRAQATAARSYTLSVMHERKSRPFQVDSDTRDQMFKWTDPSLSGMERIRDAVMSTRGLVLENEKNGEPIKAFYHADCGGALSAAKNVWSNSNGLAKTEAFCPDHPHRHWTLQLSAEHLEGLVAKWSKSPRRSIVEVQTLSRNNHSTEASSKSEVIQIHFATGADIKIPADQFRSLIGYEKLKSTGFKVSYIKSETIWKFDGIGFGHGVGLCQSGAKALAIHNKNFKEILSVYYPGTRLVAIGTSAGKAF